MPKIVIPLWANPPPHQQIIRYTNVGGRTRSYKTEGGAHYQMQLALLVRAAMNRNHIERVFGVYAMELKFYLADRRRGDWTNIVKTCEDAIFDGLLAEDDKYCEEAHCYIFYDKANPRLEIDFWPLHDNQITK